MDFAEFRRLDLCLFFVWQRQVYSWRWCHDGFRLELLRFGGSQRKRKQIEILNFGYQTAHKCELFSQKKIGSVEYCLHVSRLVTHSSTKSRSPSSGPLPCFGWEDSPTKIDYRKIGTLILTYWRT